MGLFDGIIGWVSEGVTGIKNWFQDRINDAKEWIYDKIDRIKEWVEGLVNGIKEWVSGVVTNISNWVSDRLREISEWVSEKINLLREYINQKIVDTVNLINRLRNEVPLMAWNFVSQQLYNLLEYFRGNYEELAKTLEENGKLYGKKVGEDTLLYIKRLETKR